MSKLFAVPVSELKDENSKVDERFGRASGYLIFDENGNIVKKLSNENKDAAHGAGTGAAALLTSNKVTDAVARSFGPKASDVLKASNVTLWQADSSEIAKELFENWKNNKLNRA